MRITAIHLENVGPFRRTNWSLDPARGFHLLVGPNEAGKSTVLRALGDALFGYPRTPPDGEFFQPYRDRRVGLTLASDDGGELSFLRRKATSQSLRALDDTAVVAEALLQKQLGSVDRARFERFFGLDHASLVKGGLELLGSEGDIGAILFAGSQLRGAPQVLAQLEQEAAKLFSPRAQIPRLNSHLKEHAELVSAMNQLMVKPQAWRTIKQEFDAAQAELEELGGQLKEMETRCNQLLRLNAACVPARELRHIQNQLETFKSLPLLDEAFFEKVAEVLEQHRRATEERALRLAEQQQLAASAADFPTVDPVWLDLDEALAELVATRGSILKARKDALKVREDLREQQAKLAAASQLLKTSDSSQLPALSKKIRKQLETLQSARTVLRERHSALAQRTAQLADEQTRLSLAPSFDKEALTSELLAHQARLTELSALVTREAEATSWATDRSSLEKSLRQLFKRLEGLSQVPTVGETTDLSAAWEHLAALPLPSLETIEANRQELDTLQGATRQQTATLEQIETDLARATQERQSLRDLVLNTT
ncbi:MAG: hypothetical protein C0478_10925, partial [Planctomyces sp.]|nr:hypothetical protein [Planctomyces sp.]